MRVLRRLRAGLPDCDAEREIGDRDRDARALRGHHLRLLRRRLRLQGRDARRRGRAHAALQGRQGQSRPFLRQGPLRLRLCHSQRPHAEADDPRKDHGSVARSVLGRGDQLCGLGVQAHPGEIWQELRWRHHLLALHQRRNLPGAEARARGLRQQQCRYLRAGVPFADRLRAEDHLWHLGRNAGLRLGRAGRRDHDHRRQPHRRPPGVRLSHEEAAASGRQADHPRSPPHRQADDHLPLKPGTNVAVVTSLAHVVVTEGLVNEKFVRERCDWDEFQDWAAFVSDKRHSPEEVEKLTGVPAESIRGAARLYATARNGAIYYGIGATEHSQGSTTVMAIANLAMATGNIGREGVGVNPLRGQNNVQGSCDTGSFPHEVSGYRHVSEDATRALFEALWGRRLDKEPGLRIPNMIDAALDGSFKGLYIQGEDILQSDPNTQHMAAGLSAMECVVVQDLFLVETANYAHVFLPGSTFLEKNGTFTNAARRIQMVRKVMAPKNGYEDWEITQLLSNALGYPMHYNHPSEIMDEVAQLTPTFAGVSFKKLDEVGSVQWPCNAAAPEGTPIMHINGFVRGKGKFVITEYVATDEKTGPRDPLLLTTGRILSQYNVGAQTRRTANVVWHEEDVLEIHPHDAEQRGVRDGDWVKLTSRAGETTLRSKITERVAPGVVYTTFHHPNTQVNVVTTELSDWATNCPEYKVTAVQVTPSNGPTGWQEDYAELTARARRIAEPLIAAE